jgi:hypothetical protein
VTASGLGEREQLALFDADDPRRRRAVEATDAVRHRYGERAITRARLVGSRLPAPFEHDPMTAVEARERPARGGDGDDEGGGDAAPDRDSLDDTTEPDDPFSDP